MENGKFRDVFSKLSEKLIPARDKEKTESTDQESEISLLELPENFVDLLLKNGAEIKRDTRRIEDLKHSQPQRTKAYNGEISQDSFNESHYKVTKLFKYLGYEVSEPTATSFFSLTRTADESRKPNAASVRLRHELDNNSYTLTVKGPNPDTVSEIKTVPEFEARITQTGKKEILALLQADGYILKSEVEKNRKTLKLPASIFGGEKDILIDIDTFPEFNGKQFSRAELEGEINDIKKAQNFLKEKNIFNGQTSNKGQTELLKKYLGVKGKPLILKFPK